MPFLLAILTAVVEFVLVSLAVPKSLMDWSTGLEGRWLAEFYGEKFGRSLSDYADSWFHSLFEATGLVEFSYFLALPEAKENDPFVHVEDTLGLFAFLKGRLDVFWMEIQQDVLRFCQLGLWLSVLCPFWLIHVLDGLSLRALKRQTFGYPSPFFHRYALYATGWIWAILAFFVLLPLPLPPPVYPAVVLVQGWLLNVLSANIQKRL